MIVGIVCGYVINEWQEVKWFKKKMDPLGTVKSLT